MSVIFLLIPLSILVAACFLGAFIWAVRSGQYEDTWTPARRMLWPEAPSSGEEVAADSPHRPKVPSQDLGTETKQTAANPPAAGSGPHGF
jgi:cbb3-type cytochrome oxidase maturation protein